MKATDVLMQEHRVIERVLDALDAAAGRLESGESIRPGFFVEAADFIAGFADGCHHRKEEGVLFEAMVDAGMAAREGPIAVMLREHEEGRALTRGMRDAAQRLERGDEEARRQVMANARRYVALLRDHIAKEDEVLFPMAAELLPDERGDRLLEGFARVEHADAGEGAHARFLALADRLEREAKARPG
jgi:hemerythrin-like domain-containing protein